MNGEDNGCVDNSTSRDSSVHDTDSLYVTDASKHSFQHPQECKHPFCLGKSQPLLALQWYSKWASFKSTSPDMTYAQALLKNSGIEMLFLHL